MSLALTGLADRPYLPFTASEGREANQRGEAQLGQVRSGPFSGPCHSLLSLNPGLFPRPQFGGS